MRLMRLLALAFIALALTASVCEARTFKVIDAATDLPVAGVEVELESHILLPGIGHPTELTVRSWRLTSDERGEFTIYGPFADRAFVSSLRKQGYARAPTAKEQRFRRSPQNDPNLVFLTPKGDVTIEYIRYLAYEAARSSQDPGFSPLSVAANYEIARRNVSGPREMAALRDFCVLAPLMKSEADAGWRHMGTLASMRKAALDLLQDCQSSNP